MAGTAEQRRRYDLKKRGLTEEDYDQMLKHQHRVCAICASPPTKKRRLAVDHDHNTDEVRGLLCTNCNLGLGFFQDSVALLDEAMRYLRYGPNS